MFEMKKTLKKQAKGMPHQGNEQSIKNTYLPYKSKNSREPYLE